MNAAATLPEAAGADDAPPTLLSWFVFDDALQAWVDVRAGGGDAKEPVVHSSLTASTRAARAPALTLVTWNVDAFSPQPADRLAAILAVVRARTPPVDVLFLQEVSRAALAWLLQDPWVCGHWYVSDAGPAAGGVSGGGGSGGGGGGFAAVTLVSRRFPARDRPGADDGPVLGALWRVDFPSMFGRYAVCCEMRVPSTGRPEVSAAASAASFAAATASATASATLRLVNVHLDSLQIRPSRRPRQLQIVAAILQGGDAGLVAGDFNPVLPDDDALVAANGLVDAWPLLHPDVPGVTWGIDGQQAYPPARLDKVAVVGLAPQDMAVLHPGTVPRRQGGATGNVAWSDHSGLRCTFAVTGRGERGQYD